MTSAGHSLLAGAFGTELLQLDLELLDPITLVIGSQLRTRHSINVVQFLFEMFNHNFKLFLQLLTNAISPLPLLLYGFLQTIAFFHLFFHLLFLILLVLRFLTLLL